MTTPARSAAPAAPATPVTMPLERVDIRAKLVLFVAVMVATFAIADPRYGAGFLVVLVAGLVASRTPLGPLWLMIRPLLVLFVLIATLTMFTAGSRWADPAHGAVLFRVFGWPATVGGLLTGLNFVVRILLMVVATYAFTVSTPVDDILLVMDKVHAPYWLAILVTTSISFVPTMARKKDMIFEAQRARGARAGSKGIFGELISFIPIMVPLITNSILMADNLAVAMTSRGYGASSSMTPLRDLKFGPVDIVLVVAAVLVAIAVLVARLRFGLGAL